MTSPNGNIFRVTGPLCWQFTRTKASDADISFDLRLKHGWENNCKAGDSRLHRTHYDVNVMGDVYLHLICARITDKSHELI